MAGKGSPRCQFHSYVHSRRCLSPPGHAVDLLFQLGESGSDMRVNWNFIMNRVFSVRLGQARCQMSKCTTTAVPASPTPGSTGPRGAPAPPFS